jgi:hypothetical protein
MPSWPGGYHDLVAKLGETSQMPGAQDGWGQLTEPGPRDREAALTDLPRGADRPERGSLADLRQRLERLPPGHPSSPYNDDLTRKPPVARLKDLELPFHDTNGAARHHDAGPGADAATVIAGGSGADGNGADGDGPAGNGSAVTAPAAQAGPPAAWSPADDRGGPAGEDAAALRRGDGLEVGDGPGTAEWPGPAGRPGAADRPAAADHLGSRDHLGATDGFSPSPAGRLGPRDEFTTREESGADDEFGIGGGIGSADSVAGSGGFSADGHGADEPGPLDPPGGTDGWLSAATWETQAGLASASQPGAANEWDGAAAWDDTGDGEPAGFDGEPVWAEPEVDDPGAGPPDEQPRRGADGSWAWNGRYLTPTEYQIAEEALGRFRVAEGRNVFGGYGHSGLTPAMRRIEAQLESGQLLPDTENRSLKQPDSFRKRFADLILRQPDKPADELSLDVHDGIRYAFIFDAENYAEATLQAHSRLKGHGFELEVRWNGWESREFKGINSRWRDPAHDLVFEVQFHTASSWDAWERAKGPYERIIDPTTPPAERARLRAMHAGNLARVPVPPRCTAIPDFRKEVL